MSSRTSTISRTNGRTPGRTQVRNVILTGPANSRQISVHANWSAIYSLTQKIRIVDSIHYDNWQNPGFNNLVTTSLFATGAQAAGQTGILLPVASFAPLVPMRRRLTIPVSVRCPTLRLPAHSTAPLHPLTLLTPSIQLSWGRGGYRTPFNSKPISRRASAVASVTCMRRDTSAKSMAAHPLQFPCTRSTTPAAAARRASPSRAARWREITIWRPAEIAQ